MAAIISLKGIDEAISNLNYRNPQELKYKLVHAIRGFYEDDSSIQSLEGIDAEKLIKTLWETGDDPALIKAKRKNLSSTKSSLNKDLKRLYKEGKNPEGITIGRNNLFVMSDDAKDEILSTYDPDTAKDQVASLRQIAESLSSIKDVLSNPEALADVKGSDGLAALEDLRSTVQGLAGKIDIGEQEGGLSEVGEEKGPAEEVAEDGKEISEDGHVSKQVSVEEAEPEDLEEAEAIGQDGIEEVVDEIEAHDALEEVATEEEAGEDEDNENDVQLEEAPEEAEPEDEVGEVLAEEEAEPEEPDGLEHIEEDVSIPLGYMAEVLNEILSNSEDITNAIGHDGLNKLVDLKNIIEGLSQELGPEVKEGALTDAFAEASKEGAVSCCAR